MPLVMEWDQPGTCMGLYEPDEYKLQIRLDQLFLPPSM